MFRRFYIVMLSFLIAVAVFADEQEEFSRDDNPYPTGGGRIATGIIIGSVGVGLAGMTGMLWLFSGSYSDEKIENQASWAAVALVGLGIGAGGLYIMRKGIKEKRKHKEWNRKHGFAFNLSPAVVRRSPGFTLNLEF